MKEYLHGRERYIVSKVLDIAVELHGTQKRKYTEEPYWYHCLEVAGIYAEGTVSENINADILEGVIAALLHDTIEDTGVDPLVLETSLIPLLGEGQTLKNVMNTVISLTNMYTSKNYPKMNRNQRKKQEAERLSNCSTLTINVKMADLISNTSTIAEYDPKFAETYMLEKAYFLDLVEGKEINRILFAKAVERIVSWNNPKNNWRLSWLSKPEEIQTVSPDSDGRVIFANVPGQKDVDEQFMEWANNRVESVKETIVVDKNIGNALNNIPIYTPVNLPVSREGNKVSMLNAAYASALNIDERDVYINLSDINTVLSSFDLPEIKMKKESAVAIDFKEEWSL